MHEFGRAVRLASAPPAGLLRHPVQAAEHLLLDSIRRATRWVELSGPLNAWLNKRRTHVLRNVPYLGSGHPGHRLDVYRPAHIGHEEQRPVIFYVHGGGFEVCSKDTHWVMAQSYARHGYVVFNVNYRLAPRHPFPRGLSDVCAAYLWVLDNAARFGGDPRRIVLAGDSAGANLVSSLALINAIKRPEPWAQAVYRRNMPPRAVVAACGFYEVTNAHRFRELAAGSWGITRFCIEQVSRAYLPRRASFQGEHDLANPLHVLERRDALDRRLPPFFVSCGGDDPIVDDSRRLERALSARGVPHEARYYQGEMHVFHALFWRPQARLCWADTLDFVARALAADGASASYAA